MANKRIEEQVLENTSAIQQISDDAQKIDELPKKSAPIVDGDLITLFVKESGETIQITKAEFAAAITFTADTNNYASISPPQLFNPDATAVTNGTDDYTLESENNIAFISINGQVLASNEYGLSGSLLTVTPENGFSATDDEVLAFQHAYLTVSQIGAFDQIQLNEALVSNPPYSEGLIFYDNIKKAISYYNDESETTVNLAQEVIVKIYNNNGSTLVNGTVVRLDGGNVGGVPTVVRSQADTITNAGAFGVVTHDIPTTDTGYIASWGQVGGLDTSAYTAGDFLYLSETVAGGLTNIEQKILKPIAAVIVSDALDGVIMVAQKNILNITAIGQIGSISLATQNITTTPVLLEIYDNNPFEQNVTINQTGASPYTASFSPSSVGATGFYEVSFSIALSSDTNERHFFEIYINGGATGVLGVIDLTNNNIDAGSTSFTAITGVTISHTDNVAIYVYSGGGSPTITVASCVTNMKRIGNI